MLNLLPLDVRSTPAVIAAGGAIYGSWGSYVPYVGYTGPLSASLAGNGEVAIGAGSGGGPRVSIVNPATGEVGLNLFAFEPSFRGGVFVGVDGDELLVGAGPGGAAVVAVYNRFTGQELRRTLYGNPEYRGGVTVDGSVSARDATFGSGSLVAYLDLEPTTDAPLVARKIYNLFHGLLTVTTIRPTGYDSEYLTLRETDLSYYPISVTGLATAVYQRRQPDSHNPNLAFVSNLLSPEYLAVVGAHELGHLLGLGHDSKPENIMYAPAPLDGQFDLIQLSKLADVLQ